LDELESVAIHHPKVRHHDIEAIFIEARPGLDPAAADCDDVAAAFEKLQQGHADYGYIFNQQNRSHRLSPHLPLGNSTDASEEKLLMAPWPLVPRDP
jgi:hypothetical protein